MSKCRTYGASDFKKFLDPSNVNQLLKAIRSVNELNIDYLPLEEAKLTLSVANKSWDIDPNGYFLCLANSSNKVVNGPYIIRTDALIIVWKRTRAKCDVISLRMPPNSFYLYNRISLSTKIWTWALKRYREFHFWNNHVHQESIWSAFRSLRIIILFPARYSFTAQYTTQTPLRLERFESRTSLAQSLSTKRY